MEGIKAGFKISDVVNYDSVKSVSVENHPSVNKYKDLVEKELQLQINMGNYKVTESHSPPKIVSPLGAIPKDDQEVRAIHDCSRPMGDALNNYSLHTSVQYQTIDEAYTLAKPHRYMSKIDLKSAYRSVAIHPTDYSLTGFRFKFQGDKNPTTLYDVRLPFGSSKGPMIFHRLSQAVKRMMARRGFDNVVVYLDDFLIVEESYERCREAQLALLALLVRLRFLILWKKLVGPSQRVEF